MKKFILAVITYIFLVIMAPVFAFSMLAPLAMKTILIWWVTFVAAATVILGSLSLWAYLESR
jgi:hypothetical protein